LVVKIEVLLQPGVELWMSRSQHHFVNLPGPLLDKTINVINDSEMETDMVIYKLTYSDKTMGWTIGVLGFDSRRGLGIFLFTTASRTVLGPTQPPIQSVPGPLSVEVKPPGREADHSPPSTAEVKE
jgi:hypothetical protein